MWTPTCLWVAARFGRPTCWSPRSRFSRSSRTRRTGGRCGGGEAAAGVPARDPGEVRRDLLQYDAVARTSKPSARKKPLWAGWSGPIGWPTASPSPSPPPHRPLTAPSISRKEVWRHNVSRYSLSMSTRVLAPPVTSRNGTTTRSISVKLQRPSTTWVQAISGKMLKFRSRRLCAPACTPAIDVRRCVDRTPPEVHSGSAATKTNGVEARDSGQSPNPSCRPGRPTNLQSRHETRRS